MYAPGSARPPPPPPQYKGPARFSRHDISGRRPSMSSAMPLCPVVSPPSSRTPLPSWILKYDFTATLALSIAINHHHHHHHNHHHRDRDHLRQAEWPSRGGCSSPGCHCPRVLPYVLQRGELIDAPHY